MGWIELWWQDAVQRNRFRGLKRLDGPIRFIHHLIRLSKRVPASPSLPVVSIGSPFLGGSGKTPLCLSCARWLLNQGFQTAIVSRGYRRKSLGQLVVSKGRGLMVAPTASGDELALMARRLPAAIVVANGNRSNGIQTARNLGAEIVCLDDALHHPIAKDCDLIVMHADELHQNHLMFPLGRLRYPLARLRHAHGLVIVFPSHSSEEDLKYFNHPKWVPEELPIIKARIQPDGFFDSKTHCEVEIPVGKPVAAWAAIANPERFFETLRRLDCQLTGTLACPDHQPASPRRLFSWAQAQKARGAKVIVCTEKDAMHQLPELCLPMIYLRMDLEFPEGRVQLDRLLQECLDAGFQRCQSL